jgi:hypothetical protein
MPLPGYLSNVDVFYDGVAVPTAILAPGPVAKVIVFSQLDAVGAAALDAMVAANGGVLPFPTGMAVPDAYVLPNGNTFSHVYGPVIQTWTGVAPTTSTEYVKEYREFVTYFDGTHWIDKATGVAFV